MQLVINDIAKIVGPDWTPKFIGQSGNVQLDMTALTKKGYDDALRRDGNRQLDIQHKCKGALLKAGLNASFRGGFRAQQETNEYKVGAWRPWPHFIIYANEQGGGLTEEDRKRLEVNEAINAALAEKMGIDVDAIKKSVEEKYTESKETEKSEPETDEKEEPQDY